MARVIVSSWFPQAAADNAIVDVAVGNGNGVGDAKKRITTKFMTKYERARVLGTRALQLRSVHPRQSTAWADVNRRRQTRAYMHTNFETGSQIRRRLTRTCMHT